MKFTEDKKLTKYVIDIEDTDSKEAVLYLQMQISSLKTVIAVFDRIKKKA